MANLKALYNNKNSALFHKLYS